VYYSKVRSVSERVLMRRLRGCTEEDGLGSELKFSGSLAKEKGTQGKKNSSALCPFK
jgi:hypothetical protein